MQEHPKSLADRFLRPILASRFLTISALLHLLLVVLFGGRVLFKTYVEPPDFEATSTDFVESGDNTPEPPPPPPTEALPPAPGPQYRPAAAFRAGSHGDDDDKSQHDLLQHAGAHPGSAHHFQGSRARPAGRPPLPARACPGCPAP